MRILIDLQGAQSSGSAKRGIGRYSLSLAQEMARQAQGHEVVIALNNRFPEEADSLRASFADLVGPDGFRLWEPPAGVHRFSPAGQRAAERLYEAFLATAKPDAVHISSLFEGLSDDAVTSIAGFAPMPTATTLYDLIPLIHAGSYLANPAVLAWYRSKLQFLRRADMWFAISESSRQEGIGLLGLPPDRCINVSTAASEHFRNRTVTEARERELRTQYGLGKKFVMYTGGIDLRKNLEGLIRAFALLPRPLRATHQLAIVCSASAESKTALLQLARAQGLADGELVLTGYVAEEDLIDLYNLCALFVFPSWHEGFGLPALEAMHCGAVVIGANNSSIPEVIGRADALFDPRDDKAMAAKIVQALGDDDFRRVLVEHGRVQAAKFTWSASAERALRGLEELHARSSVRSASVMPGSIEKPLLAYVSPLPPQRSGIADYSAALLPALSAYYEIELIADEVASLDPGLAARYPVRTIEWFSEHADDYDRVLYHFGNSTFHTHMFDLLGAIPGTVVLHDFFLSGIQAHRELHGETHDAWQKSLYASHGFGAVRERHCDDDVTDVIFKYPCSFPVLQQAQGVIVHSRHSIDLASQWYGDAAASRCVEIPLLRQLQPDVAALRAQARKSLGLGDEDFLVCSFGMLGPTKLNDRLVHAWAASSLARDRRCKLVMVGEADRGEFGRLLQADIDRLAPGSVQITGWTEAEKFQTYLQAADVAVQLRSLSRGETSAAVLDAMGCALPTIVNAVGSMAYLPTDAVVVLPAEFSDDDLRKRLEALWLDADQRSSLGARARDVVRRQHDPATCARSYAQAIEAFASDSRFGRDALARAVRGDPIPDGASNELGASARAMAVTLPSIAPAHQLLVDISAVLDDQSALARMAGPLKLLLAQPPHGFRIEPVYRSGDHYCHARAFTLKLLECEGAPLLDAEAVLHSGDVLIAVVPEDAPMLPEHPARQHPPTPEGLHAVVSSAAGFAASVNDCLSAHLSATQSEQLRSFGTARPIAPTDSSAMQALASAGIHGLAHDDFNHLLHHLRGEEIGRLPQNVECFVSVGCAGTWYFEWVQALCAPRKHVGIEFYSPKPDDLPPNVEWIANTAGDMSSIADGIGDVLFSGQNIEHLWPHDIVAFLRESRRVLKPGGLLAIDSPNRAVTALLNWSHPEHILEFTPQEARELVEAAGFDVVDVRGAWTCQDAETGQVYPLGEMTTEGPWPLRRRVAFAGQHPEGAFSWWLEARKGDATPDWDRVARLVDQAFAVAWPERVNRLHTASGTVTEVAGRAWIESNGAVGLLMFGPDMPLPKGRYEVSFEAAGPAAATSRMPIAAFDVISGAGITLASQVVSGHQLGASDTAAKLHFALEDTTFGIQFRALSLASLPWSLKRRVVLKSLDVPGFSTGPVPGEAP